MKLYRLASPRKSRPRRSPGGFLQAVAATCRPGLSDREVAELLGRCHQDVFRARRKLGIPSGLTLADAARRRNRIRYLRHRCWACNKRCPCRGFQSGWAKRRNGRSPDPEVYCPACFAEYGWPPQTDLRCTWTDADEELLRRMYRVVPIAELERQLGRTRKTIYLKIYRLGLAEPRVVNKDARRAEVLRLHREGFHPNEIAKRLPPELKVVRAQVYRDLKAMGLEFNPSTATNQSHSWREGVSA